MPLKNQSYKSRKHPSFNRASKAQRLRRIEEKRLAYNDSSFENNTIAPINEPDLFARETVHHIRCTRLVGDDDSNTIAKCRERISYGGRILKVECANHAVRRYDRAIQKLQGNTTRFSGIKGQQLFKQKIMKLIKGARNAIKSNTINNHNQPQRETVSNLISDLRSVPNHVFGKHDNCGFFCKKNNIETDNTDYSVMQSSGLLNAIQYEIGRTLVACK
ncbi:uncharacterized protein TNCV_406821 [Trichonephila clavipes]|nr:uncharacterized protein TNCV_406821 [Trichonephila clavipes]